ncbi:hypothetical protein GUJ93_ZPchr0001g29529 [Zizania palustris]|uniref:Uncharacterized protein n=1 Tax=Zizania palustris TaxID=103762 RepID=A0A8J5V007_ZIZPA|nr:hypothetical protein GUJ93_ZPchr0001g29529 [Zizania palustris]
MQLAQFHSKFAFTYYSINRKGVHEDTRPAPTPPLASRTPAQPPCPTPVPPCRPVATRHHLPPSSALCCSAPRRYTLPLPPIFHLRGMARIMPPYQSQRSDETAMVVAPR